MSVKTSDFLGSTHGLSMHDDEATAPLSRAHLEQVMQQRAAASVKPSAQAEDATAPTTLRSPAGAVSAPAPTPAPVAQVRATPFPYQVWPRLSVAQAQLGNRLLRMLPASHTSDEPISQSICEVLESLTGLKHELHFHGVHVLAGPAQLPDPGHAFVTRFALPPDPEFGVMAVELALVESWVRGLLDEEASTPPLRLGPVTEQEFGAITYVALRIMERLGQAHGLAPLALSSSPPDMVMTRQHIAQGLDVVEVVFVLSSEVTAGAVRLWLPSRMVQGLEVFSRGELIERRLKRRLWRSGWGQLESPLYVSAGRVELGQLELLTLGVGDVLLPAHGLSAQGLEPTQDHARLYFQESMRGAYLKLRLEPELELHQWQAQIIEVTSYQSEQERMMAQEQDLGQGKTQAIVDEARVAVELRMGSLSMSFKQLAELQPGQVLTLSQQLHSPVELVAQGRVIGVAELVNVEGRLGARVLSLRDPQ